MYNSATFLNMARYMCCETNRTPSHHHVLQTAPSHAVNAARSRRKLIRPAERSAHLASLLSEASTKCVAEMASNEARSALPVGIRYTLRVRRRVRSGYTMASLIEEIKTKVDVVEEIGLVVALQKAGKSFKGLCPFHNERTPSFYVFAESQTWRCFGCNEGGDVFSFVQKQQGLEFRDALAYLAEKVGISLEEYSSRGPEEERESH